jgi:N-acetylglutamate synthase-like GNAT family acetyltransferase
MSTSAAPAELIRPYRPLPVAREPGRITGGVAAVAGQMALRAARASDVEALLGLINCYAAQGLLLWRSEASLLSSLRDFVVSARTTARGEQVVGCGALAHLGPGLGEVRSLAVAAEAAGRGAGRRIVGRLLNDASERGLGEVLALTRRPSFFQALGFVVTRRERFPEKLEADCARCPRDLRCDEVALVWTGGGGGRHSAF